MTRGSATQALQILRIRGEIRRAAERTAKLLDEIKGRAAYARCADGLFQRLANESRFRYVRLPRQLFQSRVELFWYGASQRCHVMKDSASGGKCNAAFHESLAPITLKRSLL